MKHKLVYTSITLGIAWILSGCTFLMLATAAELGYLYGTESELFGGLSVKTSESVVVYPKTNMLSFKISGFSSVNESVIFETPYILTNVNGVESQITAPYIQLDKIQIATPEEKIYTWKILNHSMESNIEKVYFPLSKVQNNKIESNLDFGPIVVRY